MKEKPKGYKVIRRGKERIVVMDKSLDDDNVNREWLHSSKGKRKKKKIKRKKITESAFVTSIIRRLS